MSWVTREPVQVTQRPERLQPGAQQQGGKPLLAPHNQLGAWKPLRPSQGICCRGPSHICPQTVLSYTHPCVTGTCVSSGRRKRRTEQWSR